MAGAAARTIDCGAPAGVRDAGGQTNRAGGPVGPAQHLQRRPDRRGVVVQPVASSRPVWLLRPGRGFGERGPHDEARAPTFGALKRLGAGPSGAYAPLSRASRSWVPLWFGPTSGTVRHGVPVGSRPGNAGIPQSLAGRAALRSVAGPHVVGDVNRVPAIAGTAQGHGTEGASFDAVGALHRFGAPAQRSRAYEHARTPVNREIGGFSAFHDADERFRWRARTPAPGLRSRT